MKEDIITQKEIWTYLNLRRNNISSTDIKVNTQPNDFTVSELHTIIDNKINSYTVHLNKLTSDTNIHQPSILFLKSELYIFLSIRQTLEKLNVLAVVFNSNDANNIDVSIPKKNNEEL